MKKRLLSVLVALAVVFTVTACTIQNQDDPTKTTITVVNYDGGIGGGWLVGAVERFEEAYKDESFADGKTGVKVKVTNDSIVSATTMKNSGYNIYFDETSAVESAINAGNVMPIDDIVGPLESKIDVDYRNMLKGNDGKYYALPHYEFYPGATYDVDVFEKYGLYIADGTDGDYFDSEKFGEEMYFTKGTGVGQPKKSCGPDGIYGTIDDGLPSSLLELCILCEYMKERKSVTPFQLSGMYAGYSNYFLMGLWASLAGFDEMRTVYTFDGTIDAVTGEGSENLFPGISYVKKPTTEKVTVQEGNGYRAFDSVNRYYAEAFLQICLKEGWINSDSTDTSVTHTGAQSRFINGYKNGSPIGIIMEGSYWYNESDLAGNFDNYYNNYATDDSERRLAWLSLPISFDTKVTEGNGKPITVVDQGLSFAYINNNIAAKPEVVAACKAFLSFLYTDAELAAFTASTGLFKAGLSYKIDDSELEKFPYYKQSLYNYRQSGKIIWCGADNQTFRSSKTTLVLRNTHFTISNLSVNGVNQGQVIKALRNNCGLYDVFVAGKLSKGIWQSMCQVDVI